MEARRPLSPRLHRSRSGTPRLCQLSAAENPPFSPNLARSKSASKSRPPPSLDAATPRRLPKENSESPPPRPTPESCGSSRRAAVRPCSAVPSAWALSPGRSPRESPESRGRPRVGGVLGLFRRKKEPSAREEAAHQLRMLTARLLQWRFANARAEAAIECTKFKAEKKLFYAWLKVNELRNIVAAKRILIQRRKHKMKVARILSPQIRLLEQWEPHAKRHLEATAALGRVLGTICLAIPLTEGAQANMISVHRYTCIAMDIMRETEANARIFYSKQVENISSMLCELVSTVRQEIEGLEELMKISEVITSLEMQETSIRANMIQAMKEQEQVNAYLDYELVLYTNSFHIDSNIQVKGCHDWNKFLTPLLQAN
ncbi:QWRF motif-containing protein 7 isoform X1 [Phoenix dactylifera]|uniref:QWRF motif-containing protein 7 isoform X1 n=1 Tax=Phoenix dactylifera TaxID=42345 RepID=A0A8B8ZZD7_PHODC|nr:QWRF motif-containing protein 7 isoform X1 [Phoenix dactylifera]